MSDSKSAGQRLVERLEAWFAGYLALVDRDVALILALWAVGSWCFDKFYSWPYLSVTASVKGAGKSRVLELLEGVCRGAFLSTEPTPAYVLRKAAIMRQHFTLLWDEAEAATSDKKGFLSAVLNSGYRHGQTIGRAKGTDEIVEYPSYFPKAFGLIGDPTGTVRDRSIVITMVRGNAPKEYLPQVVEGEAGLLKAEIERVLSHGTSDVAASMPAWLDARDREIWGSMLGLAEWLKLDKATMGRLERWAADNVASKTAPARKNTSYESEDDAITLAYGERALRDLRSVLRDGEKNILSAEAVKRMRDIPTGPWRAFRGDGLDQNSLCKLIKRFGVKSVSVQMGHGRDGRKVGQGFTAKDIKASSGEPGEGA